MCSSFEALWLASGCMAAMHCRIALHACTQQCLSRMRNMFTSRKPQSSQRGSASLSTLKATTPADGRHASHRDNCQSCIAAGQALDHNGGG